MLFGIGVAVALSGCEDRPAVSLDPPWRDPGPAWIRPPKSIDKLDLLVVVDGSPGMAERQTELARRLPALLPSVTASTDRPRSAFDDVHVAVISSSLGSYGTSACVGPHANDRGHLLPRPGENGDHGFVYDALERAPKPAPCPAVAANGVISWVRDPARDPAAPYRGAPGLAGLEAAASCAVQSVKDDGCGFEAPWEAMYHFLVDPAPYASAEARCTAEGCGSSSIEVTGLDHELLGQRDAFPRPDSLLAVIVLSDEDDASLKPAGLNWIPWGFAPGKMQRGWTSCADVPDDFEPESAADFKLFHEKYRCFPCFEDAKDPACALPFATDPREGDVDPFGLRAFHQVQRYGYSFLYGRERYVNALTQAQVPGSDGKMGPNPIFRGGFRTSDLVVVAGVVGVPPALVANDDGSAKTLTDGDWQKLVGPVDARDPHMIESVAPREGVARFAGERVDPVNGGDRDVPLGNELQYACIGARPTSTSEDSPFVACEGEGDPLCDPSKTKRTHFGAYPGLRHLRILRDLGPSAIVSSICTPSLEPALAAVAEALQTKLAPPCAAPREGAETIPVCAR